MSTTNKFPGATIQMPDTRDHFARKIHVNVRNGKTTMVYRWKDHKSSKAHTQRMTLNDEQVARLMGAIAVAATVAVGEDKTRELLMERTVAETAIDLAARSERK